LKPRNGAKVKYGIVKELGLTKDKPTMGGKKVEIKIDGESYEAIII